MKPNRRFKNIEKEEVKNLIKELEDYVDLYISCHESNLFMKSFIDDQKKNYKLK